MLDDVIITIEKGDVRVSSKKNPTMNFTSTIPHLLEAADSGNRREMGILPPAVRHISTDHNVVVVERPPMYVPIFYTPTGKVDALHIERKDKEKYNIPVPWQVYVVRFNPSLTVGSYFRPSPLTSLDDQLFNIVLPNTTGGGYCRPAEWGTESQAFLNTEFTVADGIAFCINFMWTCNYNNNAGATPHGGPDELPTTGWSAYLGAWEKLSPQETLDLSWKPLMTVKEAMSGVTRYSYGYDDVDENPQMDAGRIAYKML